MRKKHQKQKSVKKQNESWWFGLFTMLSVTQSLYDGMPGLFMHGVEVTLKTPENNGHQLPGSGG